jgi:hypothetical protein
MACFLLIGISYPCAIVFISKVGSAVSLLNVTDWDMLPIPVYYNAPEKTFSDKVENNQNAREKGTL